ncbi:hypothetical protein cyc_08939 [Cyclospora cayetanensis]|uniref:Uncharacterized protein n=1 Tax=Cyclospora cayetanensis TaxID=88456 RepID=A0A1D3D406_9EIME|nr:hypothetical protein cyc_08939 [Cyclospora cayetanensis]
MLLPLTPTTSLVVREAGGDLSDCSNDPSGEVCATGGENGSRRSASSHRRRCQKGRRYRRKRKGAQMPALRHLLRERLSAGPVQRQIGARIALYADRNGVTDERVYLNARKSAFEEQKAAANAGRT